MTPHRRTPTPVEFPSDLDVALTREFRAPIELVFDVLWKEEHLRRTIAPFGEEVTECSVDLRVGGAYSFTFVTDDGVVCAFRGTFLEVDPPRRTVQTWHFEGWPDADAVETMQLEETEGGTRLSYLLRFEDQAGRDHMTRYDGLQANFDNLESYLRTLTGGSGDLG